MKDYEIEKALGICSGNGVGCDFCPFNKLKYWDGEQSDCIECTTELSKVALDYIDRLKSEISRLKIEHSSERKVVDCLKPKFKTGDIVYYVDYVFIDNIRYVVTSGKITRVCKRKTKITYYIKGKHHGLTEDKLYFTFDDAKARLDEIQEN
jgi:hypothetical protein